MSAAVLTESTLEDLARAANREHAQAVNVMKSALSHAMAAGDALAEARARVPRGEFRAWLGRHFDAHETTAYNYMSLARNRTLLNERGITAVYAALAFLQSPLTATALLGDAPGRGRTTPRSHLMPEAKRMREDGVSIRSIAQALGVSHTTVSCWTTPGAMEKHTRTERERGRSRAQKREADRQAGIRLAAKRAGGDLERALELSRQLLEVLDLAHAKSAGERQAALLAAHSGAGKVLRDVERAIVS